MAEVPESSTTSPAELVAEGRRHLAVKDFSSATESLAKACETLAEEFGDMGDQCGEAYLWYGKALLGLSREESGVLGDGVPGTGNGEDEDDENDEQEENGENEAVEPNGEAGKSGEGNTSVVEMTEAKSTTEKPGPSAAGGDGQMDYMDCDTVEQNLVRMVGEDEAESYRHERRRTTSICSDGTFQENTSESESYDSASSSSENEQDEDDNNSWSETFEPSALAFTGTPGIKIPGAATMTPLDYFKIFFNLSFLTNLARATNAHAIDVMARGFKPESRMKRWRETNAEELLTFLGILFYMGTVRLNAIAKYWSKTHLVQFSLNKYMSQNRFQLILRMLYFKINNVGDTMYSQVEHLISYFNNLMRDIVYPDKELTIDESMVLFRGRLLIRQYIKNKRNKLGIKLYVLADPSGLVYRVHMYKGSADSEVSGRGHADKVVLKLLNDYLNSGHHVYMDNYYNSINLAEILLEKKTYCTGTLSSNRKKNPSVVTSAKLKRGQSVHRSNRKGVCVMKWKDKRDVLTLSTEHTPDMMNILNRRGRAVQKPKIVLEYNKCMKGVDRHDQMLAYYPCEHKTLRWYKKIGIHMFQSFFLNAYFLYKKGTSSTLSLESFRDKVLDGLLPPSPASRNIRPQLPTHMPEELKRNTNGVIMRRKCFRCWNKLKKRKESGMHCPDCDKSLCLSCYGPYHKENNLLP